MTVTNPSALSYDVFSPSALQAVSGSIVETCRGAQSPKVDLDHGTNGLLKGNGAYQPRMCNLPGTEFLPYNIYVDQTPQYSTVWGTTSTDGTSVGAYISPAAGFGATITQNLHFQIPAGVNIPPDNYSDVIVATMTF